MKRFLGVVLTALFMAAMILLGAAAGLTIYSAMRGEAPWQRADNADSTGAADSAGEQDGAGEQEGGSDGAEEPSAAVREGDLGSYHVEIKGAAAAADYEGKDAIVVTYSWTNNSGSTASAYEALRVKAFQNGAPLDSAVVIDSEKFDFSNYMREIRPGSTTDVQIAFHINSKTTAVDIEISELGSSSGDMVTMEFDLAKLE